MQLRAGGVVLITVLVVVSGFAGTATGAPVATSSPSDAPVNNTIAAENTSELCEGGPPDPESDVLGWEAGCWHNQTIAITPADGYNETEIDRVVARSMARVEFIRRLEFDETPTVKFVTREEYRNFTNSFYSGLGESTKQRLHQNTKFEALFLVPEDESYFKDFVQNRGGIATAFHFNEDAPEYGFSEGDIGIIVPQDGKVENIPEPVLGHELYHFVQNNRFDNSRFSGGATEEAANVNLSIGEGDATYVQQTYVDRCGMEWDCLPTDDPDPPSFANLGLVFLDLGPYSSTATLFDRLRREGGVEAMNRVYENPPDSTEQFLHPGKYPNDTPTEVTYEDRSSDAWDQQTFEGGVDYATFGEMGLFVMLWYPSYKARQTVAISPNYPFTGARGNTYIRYDYAHPASAGWDGDKMFIYTTDSSAETNETAYVWKIIWDSSEDAVEFRDAYYKVLEHYGGEEIASGLWVIEDGGFADAFHINVEGDTVTIVNAPTVDQLPEVRAGIPSTPTPTPPSPVTSTTARQSPATSPVTTSVPSPSPTTTPGQPGFGFLPAVAGLAASLLWWRRR